MLFYSSVDLEDFFQFLQSRVSYNSAIFHSFYLQFCKAPRKHHRRYWPLFFPRHVQIWASVLPQQVQVQASALP
jgi:hypothetical protein